MLDLGSYHDVVWGNNNINTNESHCLKLQDDFIIAECFLGVLQWW